MINIFMEVMDNIMNRSIGTNWTANNLKTLLNWILIGAYYIECLELSIISSRRTLRYNIILGLILSTLTGTLNLTQFNLIDNQTVNYVIKGLLTAMAFIIAINTGRIKVYQYQESLEEYIRIKQEWIQFVVNIAAELQLPIDLRQDALYIIMNYKGKYLDLLKTESEISEKIKEKIKNMMTADMTTLMKYDDYLNYVHENKNNVDDVEKAKIKRLFSDRKNNPITINKFGIKISELILSLVLKEELNLLELQKYEEFDMNIDLREVYDKIINSNGEKKENTSNISNNMNGNLDGGFNGNINGNIVSEKKPMTDDMKKLKQVCMPRMVSSKKRSMSPSQELDAEELFSHQMSPCKSNPRTPIQSVSRTPKLRLSETKRNLYDNSDYNLRDVVINVEEYNDLQSELEHARNEMTMIRRHYENNLINQNKEIDLLGKQLEQERTVNDILKNKMNETKNVHFDENTYIDNTKNV